MQFQQSTSPAAVGPAAHLAPVEGGGGGVTGVHEGGVQRHHHQGEHDEDVERVEDPFAIRHPDSACWHAHTYQRLVSLVRRASQFTEATRMKFTTELKRPTADEKLQSAFSSPRR